MQILRPVHIKRNFKVVSANVFSSNAMVWSPFEQEKNVDVLAI